MNIKKILITSLLAIGGFNAIAQCTDPFTLVQSTPVACARADIQLNATDYPGATYTWTGPAGSGVGGVMPSSVTLNNLLLTAHNGTYTVTVVLPGGCTYTASLNLSVESTPNAPSVSYNDKVCSGDDNVLTGVTGGAPGVTYYWSGPNGFNYSNTNNMVTLFNMQTTDAGTYSLYAETPQGCRSETTTFSIFVYPDVVAFFDTELKPGCEDDTVLFKNLSTNNLRNLWEFGNGVTSTDEHPLHIYAVQGAYTVRLIVDNAGVCFDTLEKIVEIDHFITADFKVDDDSICQGTLVTFTNNTTYKPALLPYYEWDIKDGPKSDDPDITHQYDRYGEYEVTLIVTDRIGCKDTAKHIVVVDSAGKIGFETSANEICIGKPVTFNGDFLSFQHISTTWDMADGNILANKSDFTYNYDKPGTYPVKFSVDYRICPDLEVIKEILVKDVPKINLGDDKSICPNGKPIVLKDEINSDNPKASWIWNDKTGNKTSSINVRHEGIYAATVEIDGCSQTDTVVIGNNCYINLPNAFSPNGDGNSDYFLPREFLTKGVKSFNMQIFNRWGQPVFETSNVTGRGWDGTMNGKAQPLGVYVYLIKVAFVDGNQENYKGNITLMR